MVRWLLEQAAAAAPSATTIANAMYLLVFILLLCYLSVPMQKCNEGCIGVVLGFKCMNFPRNGNAALVIMGDLHRYFFAFFAFLAF